jgi:hypothetical protein
VLTPRHGGLGCIFSPEVFRNFDIGPANYWGPQANICSRRESVRVYEKDMSETLATAIPSSDVIRENELRKMQGFLRSGGLIFSFSHHYLYHKSNSRDIADDVRRAVDLMKRYGIVLRVVQGVFDSDTFALKSPEGVVLQKLQNSLRIFFRASR